MNTSQQVAQKRRRERQDYHVFAALVAEPATAPFSLPANGRFRVVATLGALAGDLACILTSSVEREIRTPLLTAGGYVSLNRVERAVVITLEPGFELWVDAGLGRYVKVAEIV